MPFRATPRLRCGCTGPRRPTVRCPACTRCTAAVTSSGTNLMDDPLFDELCPRLGIVGVSVDYRLAPETPYPGPLEDCYRGLRWTYEHAAELGVDPDRIGVAGVSAGGGLAAALALLARDRGEVPVAFQLLDSPMLDDRQTTPSSRQDGLPVWSRNSNTFGWKAYLGERYGRDDIPATAAPARATDLSGLPPTFVSVGAVDGFCDEDVDYALRLNRAGVPTELHVYPGACHGFNVIAPTAPVSKQAARDMRGVAAPPAAQCGAGDESIGRRRRRLVPAGTGTPAGEVHRDLGRRPRRRAGAHLRGPAPRRVAGPGAEDRRDAPGSSGVGVRGRAVLAGRDERGRGPAAGDREAGAVPLRPDAAGLLRRRRPCARHGHQRRVGVGELPVADHRVLRQRVLRHRRTASSASRASRAWNDWLFEEWYQRHPRTDRPARDHLSRRRRRSPPRRSAATRRAGSRR